MSGLDAPNPPAPAPDRTLTRPLLIFDGDCSFCRRTVERIKEITGDRADYASSQEVGADFPSIFPAEFQREVKLVEPGGRVSGAAEAVFRLIAVAGGRRWWRLPRWAYEVVPGVRPVTEAGYRFVAEHRTLFSTLTRWLWGNDLRRPTYGAARIWFLRVLATVYFAAFCSLRVQVDGLIGPNGILPVESLLRFVNGTPDHAATASFLGFPSLLRWLGGGEGALHFLCDGGMILAGLLFVGVAPAVCLTLLWVFYLSLTCAGGVFMGYQWDALLLETGFLSIFLAPAAWWTSWRGASGEVSRGALFLLRFLLFRLMFMSGLVKLSSGDPSWRDLTALRYHFETQPLPTRLGWWAHQLPASWQTASALLVFAAELAAPLLIWGPRRVRLAAFWILFALQALIALTGNYGFFNLLTAALCLLLLDDTQWPRWLTCRARPTANPQEGPRFRQRLHATLLAPVGVIYVVFGLLFLRQAAFPAATPARALDAAYDKWIAPLRSLNSYGLFASMTTMRPEIVIEGSDDAENWRPYDFRWKPGDPLRAPPVAGLHLPRLDWQMWFAALDRDDALPWFEPLLVRLLHGTPEVVALFETNPFPAAPPRRVRARLYRYHFTDLAERRRTGAWWLREEVGLYFPAVSLDDVRDSR